MARKPRIIIPDAPTVYHVMSRAALDNFPFEDICLATSAFMVIRMSVLSLFPLKIMLRSMQ